MTDSDLEQFVDDPSAEYADKYGSFRRVETHVFSRSTLAPLFRSGVYDFNSRRSLEPKKKTARQLARGLFEAS